MKPRLPQSSVLLHETYAGTPETDLGAYDDVLKAFQVKQKLPRAGWTAPISKRVENAEALKGRAELTKTLRTLGFPIK